MKRARIAAVAGAAVVAAVAAAVLLRAPARPAATPAAVPEAVASRATVDSVPSPPVVPAPDVAAAAPSFAPKFAEPPEALPDLLARARAGDVEAMVDLGMSLQECRADKLADLDKRIRRLETRESKLVEVRPDGSEVDQREVLVAGMRHTIARCESVPPEERNRAFAWIERAAVAGDLDAREMFFTQALDDFPDEAAVIANIDEVEHRRDVARRFAREDIAACVDGVFDTQSRAFDVLGMADPVERMAILHAALLMQPRGGNSAQKTEMFDAEAQAVDEFALIEARRRGAALYAHCAP